MCNREINYKWAIFNSWIKLPEGTDHADLNPKDFCVYHEPRQGTLNLQFPPPDAPVCYLGWLLSLVGGLEHELYDFPYIGNVIIPTGELHHFSEG